MAEHAARLERLLHTHQDVACVQGTAEALVKKDELLVLNQHADAVHGAARRWVDRREDFAEIGVARLRLRAGARIDVPALVDELRGGASGQRRTSVTPNHVLRGEPGMTGGPFGGPSPTAALPAPSPAAAADGTGRRVVVGVLDTGIDAHPWFAGTDWYGHCTAEEHEDLAGPHDWELDSEAGHGTFIAGVILQMAAAAYLRVERVLAADGVCDELELLHSLARLTRRSATAGDDVDVVNLSLGCFTFDDRPSPVLADAIARLARTTVVVAAAGNDSSDRPFWPAALKDVLAVAALAKAHGADGPERASFSNYGWWVDASTVGEDVASSFLTVDEQDQAFRGYATWSGTSFAAPRVAGSIAALMSDLNVTARDAVSMLLDPAVGTHTPDLGAVV